MTAPLINSPSTAQIPQMTLQFNSIFNQLLLPAGRGRERAHIKELTVHFCRAWWGHWWSRVLGNIVVPAFARTRAALSHFLLRRCCTFVDWKNSSDSFQMAHLVIIITVTSKYTKCVVVVAFSLNYHTTFFNIINKLSAVFFISKKKFQIFHV